MTKRRKGNLEKRKQKKFNSEIFPKSAREIGEEAEKRHSKGIERIMENPEKIGIKDSHFIETEVEIFDGKEKISALDIWISNTNTCYLVEYKSNDCRGGRKEAKRQLRNARDHIEEKYLRENVKMLYAYNGNEVLELTKKGYFRKFP